MTNIYVHLKLGVRFNYKTKVKKMFYINKCTRLLTLW